MTFCTKKGLFSIATAAGSVTSRVSGIHTMFPVVGSVMGVERVRLTPEPVVSRSAFEELTFLPLMAVM